MYKRLIISGLMKTVSNYPIPNTFRMKVKCALYIEIEAEEELQSLDFDALPQPVMVLGGGSNLLFTKDFPGTVLHYGAKALSGGTPFASLTPAPPTVSCVPASPELVSGGPHPPSRARGWARPPLSDSLSDRKRPTWRSAFS